MSYGNYPDLRGVRRALVIKMRHLGDVLLTTPVFSALKRAMPKARIDAYVYGEAVPILEGHPAIGEILGYDRGWKKLNVFLRMAREVGMLREIRRRGYDLVINLTEGDRGAMAARLSGARVRVGVDERRIYTHVVKSAPSLRHTVERQLDAVRRIGIFPAVGERELFFHVPDGAKAAMRERVKWERFILIHPTSRWRFKCWPSRSVHELAKRLIEQGERIVFTSGPDAVEREMVDEIVRGLPLESVLNLSGALTIKEWGALIGRCAALVCVDSVALHVASALKAPVVALFGPTSDTTWGPWQNPRARIVAEEMSCRPCYLDGCGGSKHSDCLHRLPVESVLSQLEVVTKISAPRLSIVH